MSETKNILIIGGVGVGKTTLANILSGTDEFKEDSSSYINSWRAKDKEIEGTKYWVVDTVGLGDKTLTKEELLEKFEEEIGDYIDEGISQIFFVIDNKRINERVLTEFLWLDKHLFDKKALDYTTIVKTNFEEYDDDENECKEYTNELIEFFARESNSAYKDFIRKVLETKKIIYVSNPTLDIEDEEELKLNREDRNNSRVKLLNYLNKFSNKDSYKPSIRKWLDKKYPENDKRKEITYLNIESKANDLQGLLSLKNFTNLKYLNCSKNQITSLDLSDCLNLKEIIADDNAFFSLFFLKFVSSLKRLSIANNKKLFPQSLGKLVSLKELDYLNISNCTLEGSLKPLKEFSKLEELHITNTDLNEGLEYLPESCKKLYCNSDYQYKSAKIMDELDKSKCSETHDNVKYYNLNKWREVKQNDMIASIIPLERLYVIRGNVKQFLKKWGTRKEGMPSELNRLQSPAELWKLKWVIYSTQLAGRVSAIAGAILTFQDQGTIGGGILGAYPLTELVVTKLEESLKSKERKWTEFLADVDTFLDNYHELMGILAQFEVDELRGGTVNETLKNLDQNIKEFLKTYDSDNNEEIDLEEILKQRKQFSEEISKLREIISAIEQLEKAIIEYRKSSYGFSKPQTNKKLGNQLTIKSGSEVEINIESLDQETGRKTQAESTTSKFSWFDNLVKRKNLNNLTSNDCELSKLKKQEKQAHILQDSHNT